VFGHLGKRKWGEYEGRVPNYEDGDLEVLLPMSAFPGKPLGPAFVLILRLVAKGPRLSDGAVAGSTDHLVINPTQYDSKGRKFRFEYTVNIDERGEIIRDKPPVEAFSASGKKYTAEEGRVFLVDLTADPPTVSQVKLEVADVLPRPDQDPSLEDLKAAVEKLAGKEKVVRDFVAACNKK
jgi:hypothetical protein